MKKSKIEAYFAENWESMLADIRALVAIDSARAPAQPGMPYGPGCAAVLEAAAKIGERMGFRVRNFDNRVITLDIGENPVLGVLAHLDIVPAGEGWHYPPFGAVIENGRMYGRGTADDKAAAVAAMYAAKAAAELGELTQGCRLILGADEECGCSDLEYYMACEEMPPMVFSPDADFPVYNTEKGLFFPEFSAQWEENTQLPRLISFKSGAAASNVVPASARAQLEGMDPDLVSGIAEAYMQANNVQITVTEAEKALIVDCFGFSAHASRPWEGKNAVTALLGFLAQLPLQGCGAEKLRVLAELFPFGDDFGKALNIAEADDISGPLTVNLSILDADLHGFKAKFDSRCPVCTDLPGLVDKLEQCFAARGICLDTREFTPAHHTAAESAFVQTLLKAYETFTGEKGDCLAMGGCTYAHGISGAVSFGPAMPGVETNLHGIDEYVILEDLLCAAKIYTLAIMEICA